LPLILSRDRPSISCRSHGFQHMAANGHQKTGRSSNPTIYVHMAANDTRSSNPQKKFELNHVRHDDDDVRSIPIRGLKIINN